MEDWGDNKVKDKKKKRMNEVCEEKKGEERIENICWRKSRATWDQVDDGFENAGIIRSFLLFRWSKKKKYMEGEKKKICWKKPGRKSCVTQQENVGTFSVEGGCLKEFFACQNATHKKYTGVESSGPPIFYVLPFPKT